MNTSRNTQRREFARAVGLAMVASLGAACGGGGEAVPMPDMGINDGFDDLAGAALTDLSSQCSFSSGTVTLDLNAGDIAILSRGASNEIAVNGFPCAEATASNTRLITVTGANGSAETLILDYQGGLFAAGRSSTVGVSIDLGTGNDSLRIRGSTGVDRITMGADGIAVNTDSTPDIAYTDERVLVSLGAGNDFFSGAGGNGTGTALTSSVTVYGGLGNDTLRGGTGDDTLYGGEGNDTFTSAATDDGGDIFYGGEGTDLADYSTRTSSTSSITVTIDNTANDGLSGEADNVRTDVENVRGSSGNDRITGSIENNVLSGGPGNDTLIGGNGDDTLNGDAGDDIFMAATSTDGADIFAGGAGTDTVNTSSRSADQTITLDGRANDGLSGENDNFRTDIENVVGGAGADTITGGSGANRIDGRGGADTLNGGAGNDTLIGGLGADTLNGDAGNDTFVSTSTDGADTISGGIGTDTVDYSARTASVTVTLDTTADDGGAGEGDRVNDDVENILTGSGNDVITGSSANNTISSGGGADTINGGGGNDTISGGTGNDTINGGDGDDTIDGQAGTDTIDCEAGQGDICSDPADCAAATACEL
jgi:Ca2+-binding RTX toxin-like protein